MKEWIVIGLETGVPWPVKEAEVEYRGHKFLLRPETETEAPSIAFQCLENMARAEGLSLCREFMSALAWVEGHSVKEETVTGGGFAIKVGKGPKWKSIRTPEFQKDYLPHPADKKAKLALALYREALNINSDAYAFLGFSKILNIIHKSGPKQIEWINQNINKITDYYAQEVLNDLKGQVVNIGEHLYTSGRCAVAHAYEDPVINPDSYGDVERLRRELSVIRALAELAIEKELSVKSQSTVWKEHLYELEGFRQLIPEYIQSKLKEKQGLNIAAPIQLPNLKVGIRDAQDYPGFSELKFNFLSAEDGVLLLHGQSPDSLLEMRLGLDFHQERLLFDLERGVRINNNGSRASIEYAIARNNFLIDLLSNGIFEVSNAQTNELLGRTDPYIPVNIDLRATVKNIQRRNDDLKRRMNLVP